jgi:adenosylmethionine-8-amino-7-oxononanoate aminotransferase
VSLRNTYKVQELAHGLEAVVVPDQWAESGSTIYVEGCGIAARDIDGKEYLDASSCGLCNVIGYGNKDVVGVALFLASELSAYVTGASIPVGGGLPLRPHRPWL